MYVTTSTKDQCYFLLSKESEHLDHVMVLVIFSLRSKDTVICREKSSFFEPLQTNGFYNSVRESEAELLVGYERVRSVRVKCG